MMPTKLISLNLLKKQVVVIHDDDDELLIHYEAAAIAAFESITNRTLIAKDEALPDPVGNVIQLDDSIKQGILLLVGDWYANREPVGELPKSIEYLWLQHRWVNV